MLTALSIALPLIMAAVLLVSGAAKLRAPEDLAGWVELGVPAAFRRQWLVRLHPWGELALGVALAALGGILGFLAALVAVALMAAYLWLVWRALSRSADASCSCFGARTSITRLTVVRNAWLTVLALAAAAVIWTGPTLGGALAAAVGAEAWAWIAMSAIAVGTALLIAWPEPKGASTAGTADSVSTARNDDAVEYHRVRTPAVPLKLANGETVNLRRLAANKPILILAVSPICGACGPVIGGAPQWRALLPEVDVRLLVTYEPGGPLTETTEPQSLHDPFNYLSESLAGWYTPSAVLLGVDGLLAGGPVTGPDEVAAFVAEIRESLDAMAAVVENGASTPS